MLFPSCKDKKHPEVTKTENLAKADQLPVVKDSLVAENTTVKSDKYSKDSLKGYYFEDVDSSAAVKIHDKVWHYLMKVDKQWIKDELNNPHFYYIAEHQERDSTNYYAIRLTHELDGMLSTLQWLYLDLEKDKIYEYDLPNDELILFTR